MTKHKQNKTGKVTVAKDLKREAVIMKGNKVISEGTTSINALQKVYGKRT